MSTLLEQASLIMIPSGYKEDVVYSVIPENGNGDLAFTRASNGTRINSAGLVEVVPWNLITYSEDFSNGAWNKNNTVSSAPAVTANDTTAPNGTLTADKIVFSNGVGGAINAVYQYFTTFEGARTASVWLKSASGTPTIYITTQDDTTGGNYTTCVLSTEWQRFEVTYTTAALNVQSILIGYYPGAGTPSGPSGSFTIYAWGAQLNIGSTANPYFPTTDRLNVPRLTYQNGGGGCPSLLLEKQSTNIIPYSENFENWTTGFSALSPNAVTANYGISPDGTQNADRIQLTINASNTVSQIYQFPSSSNTTYTASVWLKSLSGTPTVAIVDSYNITGGYQLVTLTTEWVRHTVTFAASSGGIIPQFLLLYGTTSNSADFLAWGFQLEASSYPTSYIPTTSSSATRVADACKTSGLSAVLPQTAGTLFWDIEYTSGTTSTMLMHNTGISDYGFVQVGSNGIVEGGIYESGTMVDRLAKATAITTGRHKMAFAYETNSFALYVDGSLADSGTSGSTASISMNTLSLNWNSTTDFTKVNQAILFPTRLTNAELASLTTI